MNTILHDATNPAQVEVEYFSPAEYFLGIAKHAVASRQDVRAALPGMGEVAILPSLNEYIADVPDMREFCQAPVSHFNTTSLSREDISRVTAAGKPRNIKDLLWQAAFHASQGRLVESRVNGEAVHLFDVIGFHHWPNLTRLPMSQNSMRICALLTRQPSSIMLVHRKLGIQPEEVYQVYSAACSAGLVNVVSNHMAQAELEDANVGSEPTPQHGLIRSLFNKVAGL